MNLTVALSDPPIRTRSDQACQNLGLVLRVRACHLHMAGVELEPCQLAQFAFRARASPRRRQTGPLFGPSNTRTGTLHTSSGKAMADTLLSAIRAMSGAGSLAELQATLNHSDTEAQVP
jgi:hypothetical protein